MSDISVDGSGRVHVKTPAGLRSYQCQSVSQAHFLADLMRDVREVGYNAGLSNPPRWKWGWLARKESAWIGVHYSPHNKRWCINLIPFVTFWITKPGGNTP